MAIEVRFVHTDLAPGEVVVYDEAATYEVVADNTLLLMNEDGEQFGIVHAQRWAAARILAGAGDE